MLTTIKNFRVHIKPSHKTTTYAHFQTDKNRMSEEVFTQSCHNIHGNIDTVLRNTMAKMGEDWKFYRNDKSIIIGNQSRDYNSQFEKGIRYDFNQSKSQNFDFHPQGNLDINDCKYFATTLQSELIKYFYCQELIFNVDVDANMRI